MVHNIYNESIFDSPAQALVNPVNCVGIMGKGLAKQFLKKMPVACNDYFTACNNGNMKPGNVLVVGRDTKFVIHFPTKRHWKDNSRLKDIISGLKSLHSNIEFFNIKSIAIPPLGCGLGCLNWEIVKTLIIESLEDLKCEIFLYNPKGNI
jgi:O-acetyl-ADP-ribose deacetylase (regulator of RNase III)